MLSRVSLRLPIRRSSNSRLGLYFQSCAQRNMSTFPPLVDGRMTQFISKLRGNYKSFNRMYLLLTNQYVTRGLRAMRLMVLGFTIYQAGYSKGIMSVVASPDKLETNLIAGVAQNAGADKILPKGSKLQRKCESVGKRVLAASKSLVKSKIKELEDKEIKIILEILKTKDATGSLGVENLQMLAQERETWERRLRRLKGEWDFIVLGGPRVNAFVTELCPRKIFVHENFLLTLDPTDDELGLVLSHEISHLLLEHNSESANMTMVLSFAQLFLTGFIDPTGVFSTFFDWCSMKIASIIQASYSRDHETEADNLGLEIASEACFNAVSGIKIFSKMQSYHEKRPGVQHNHTHWLDTHPCHKDRIANLVGKSDRLKDIHKDKCKTYAGILSRILF